MGDVFSRKQRFFFVGATQHTTIERTAFGRSKGFAIVRVSVRYLFLNEKLSLC